MGRILLVFVLVVLFLFAFYDLMATPKHLVKFMPKPAWLFVLLLVPVGPLLWLFFGSQRGTPPPRRGFPPARGPDDDPDYLRGI